MLTLVVQKLKENHSDLARGRTFRKMTFWVQVVEFVFVGQRVVSMLNLKLASDQ